MLRDHLEMGADQEEEKADQKIEKEKEDPEVVPGKKGDQTVIAKLAVVNIMVNLVNIKR